MMSAFVASSGLVLSLILLSPDGTVCSKQEATKKPMTSVHPNLTISTRNIARMLVTSFFPNRRL